jgi:hypothetical protein
MEDNRELLENLRALAADGPQDAPDRVEWELRAEFRKRSRRSRVKVWTSFAGAAAMAAGIALLLWVRPAPKSVASGPPAAVTMASASPVAVAADEEADASFYPLPEAEALPAVENAMVVRVQLPASSLRLMGFPVDVDEERADAAVQAELLLGQDGLARGVRLAQ